MDSSSEISRRHKKSSRKHKKRSISCSRSPEDQYESTELRNHSHNRSSKNNDNDDYIQQDVITNRERSRSQEVGREKERRHKHRHKKHKERKHRESTLDSSTKRKEIISITVENSDSDSSDCIEVPVDTPPAPIISKRSNTGHRNTELVAPPPPVVSKHGSLNKSYDNDSEDAGHSGTSTSFLARRSERDDSKRREREREFDRQKERDRDREREIERQKEREKDREREREHRERERMLYERERADRERERADRERAEWERDRADRENYERERADRDRDRERDRHRSHRSNEQPEKKRKPDHSPSPIAENGAGDSLSIEETNKLRLKLGLKPLELNSGPTTANESSATLSKRSSADKNLASYTDEWGEFLHKPADNIKDKKELEKIREKIKEKKEKRFVEDRLKRIRTLGESDDEVDDLSKWINRNKQITDQKKEAEKRAKALEEMDAEFGIDQLMEKETRKIKQKTYNDKHLRGLRVDHDLDDFTEGKTVILTLKDKGVLDEDDQGDTLVNVNMIDEERYRKNVENKKQNPLSYGYDVYEEMYDEFGDPIDREILQKYDEELDGGSKKKKAFTIGENFAEEREHKRKLLEIKTKLAGKRLETLSDTKIQLASDTFSETEIAKFKKPRRKIKKLRQKLKAEDLVPLSNEPLQQHLGSRSKRFEDNNDNSFNQYNNQINDHDFKIEEEDEEDLQRVLSKAIKLKQTESIIKMSIPAEIKSEIKTEPDSNVTENGAVKEGNITLNATAEFCRTLGDIPTYGMAGNRDEDSNDMMDFEASEIVDERKYEEPEASTGTWNSVNPEDVIRPMEDDTSQDIEDVAILDEEPDVGAGVGNALRLALSKGYLEKEDSNRPSNTKMAHLQAKNYSIEDKSAGDDEKFGRRDRFHAGPIMDFRDKDTFKPNVKLEYIDDNGRILNLKEAFRYLSHKFHGKGPGKNKIEKRLKKMQQDGLMKTMSSTDTPLGTLTMLQQKQRETKTPYVVLSGGKQAAGSVTGTTISKYK